MSGISSAQICLKHSAPSTARMTRAIGAFGLCCLILSLSSSASAAGAIMPKGWTGGTTLVNPGESATATETGGGATMAGNPSLNGSAWAHAGDWWNIQLGASPQVTIRVEADDAAQFAPGVSMWTSGATLFDGGTTGFAGETSTSGNGTPHSFNAYGPLGDSGTLWMQNGQGGNMLETLGYSISGPSVSGTASWGETILNGAHDVRLSNTYVSGFSGSASSGVAEIVLTGVSGCYYTLFVGGTQPGLPGGLFDVTVTSVPEPTTAFLLGLGLLGLTALRSRP